MLFSPLGVALGIAFAYGWELTLFTFAFVPFMVIAGALEAQQMVGEVRNIPCCYFIKIFLPSIDFG